MTLFALIAVLVHPSKQGSPTVTLLPSLCIVSFLQEHV